LLREKSPLKICGKGGRGKEIPYRPEGSTKGTLKKVNHPLFWGSVNHKKPRLNSGHKKKKEKKRPEEQGSLIERTIA